MLNHYRRILVSVLLLFGFHPSIGNGQTGPQLTADDLTVLKVTETAIQLGRQFPDSIWPGYNLDQIPLIVYIPDRWALLLNAPQSANGFVDYPNRWPGLQTHVLYHPGQYEELVGQLAFDLQIDSTAVAAVGFTGQNERGFLEYVVHENFHQFQHARFGEIQWEREELYPIEDASNTSLACLEIHLLKDAVKFLKQEKQDSVRNRISQFVAIRYYRWREADAYVERYEQGQEINEGTAKYVEMRAVSLVPKLRYNSSLGGTTYPMTVDLASVTMPDCIIEGLNRLIVAGTIAPEDMPRNRIYPVGAAQGFLLDQLAVDWKAIAQQAGPGFTFADLLRRALGIDSSTMASLVVEAQKIYDFETIYEKSKGSILAYRTGFDSAMTVFESQPGIRAEMRFNGKNLMRSRSSSSKKWLTDSGSRELRDHYEVYVLRSLSAEEFPTQLKDAGLLGLLGQEFRFQLKDAGLFELTNWSTKDKELVFYCPEIESLVIDGILQNTTSDAEYRFEKLRLSGANFELKSGRAGTISISNHHVAINLLP